MKETDAKSLTDSIDLNQDGTPFNVRVLPKKPGTSLSQVGEEWSAYVSQGVHHVSPEEWDTLASQLREKGYNVVSRDRSITVW